MTEKIKVLNLYSGIGGNRKLWTNVDVTAIEIDPEIAKIYQDFFPEDKVIITDAHQYLLDHYKEFDFIWSSPPCPTHSRFNLPLASIGKARYPDMKLYEEIIFLKHFFKGKYVVENVTSYYKPLIKPFTTDGHYFWCNFVISNDNNRRNFTNMTNEEMAKERLIDLDYLKSKTNNYEIMLKNCVLPKTALYLFEMAFKEKQLNLKDLMEE